MARVQPGDTAPDFSLNDADGKPVSLADRKPARRSGSTTLKAVPDSAEEPKKRSSRR